MLRMLMDGSFEWGMLPFILLGFAALVFVTTPVHEWAHAFVADRLGDDTPYRNGRLTLNPFKHFDPFGTAMLVLFGFGYAKPVPVNARNFRNPRTGMALTALAGPVSNLLMAYICVVLFRIVILVTSNTLVLSYASLFLITILAQINIGLAIFNLLPIPPLDGSHILSLILPAKWRFYMAQYQQYIRFALILLVFSGVLSRPLWYLSDFILNLFFVLAGFGF